MASRPRARRYHPAMGRRLFCFASSPPLLFATDEEGFPVVAAQNRLSTAIQRDGNQQGGHLDFCSAGLKLASTLKSPLSVFPVMREKNKTKQKTDKYTLRVHARIVHSKWPQPRPNDRAIIIRQRTPYHTAHITRVMKPRAVSAHDPHKRREVIGAIVHTSYFDVLLFKVSLQIRHA